MSQKMARTKKSQLTNGSTLLRRLHLFIYESFVFSCMHTVSEPLVTVIMYSNETGSFLLYVVPNFALVWFVLVRGDVTAPSNYV